MESVSESKNFDEIDEAEEDALLKSDDENEASALHTKATLSALQPPGAMDEDDSLILMEGMDSVDGTQTVSSNQPDEDIDDTSDDDDDEDDDDNNGGEVKILRQYHDTLKDLEVNQFVYDKYMHLCELAHATSDLENIRTAYNSFSNVYPLSAELWSKYLSNEKSVAQSEQEIAELVKLYKKALNDYYSIDLALELAELAPKSENPAELWKELLATYGLHTLKGRDLYQLYRKQIEADEHLSVDRRQELYIESYIKELQLPLLNMEESFIEFKIFFAKNEEDLKDKINWPKVENDYYRAKDHLEKILPYENQLLALDPTQYRERSEVYLTYIKETDKYLNENILQSIYERMVADCCLNPNCWMTYIEFIEYRDEIKRPSELLDYPVFLQSAIDINRKALRNCVWSDKLYIKLMFLLEVAGKPREEIQEVLETSMSAGFQTADPAVAIWLEYLTFLRRHTDWDNEEDCQNLRKNFDYAWNFLSRTWGSDADPNLEILKLWGRLEYGPLQDPLEGKAIWNNIMANAENSARSGLWIEFAQLEQKNGLNSTRNLYRTALQMGNLDNPFVIASTWERFERCNGSIKTLNECKKFCSSIMENYSFKADPFAQKKNKLSKKSAIKRKVNDDDSQSIPEKKTKKVDRSSKKDDNEPSSSTANDTKRNPKETPFKDHENQEIDLAKDHLRIFLSNLDYNLTEDDIRSGLSELNIVNVDLIRSANGRSRGFGYLELESAAEVAKALKMDGKTLNGRPLYISSVLRDKEQRQKFKYSASMEPKKLFVKGLPNDTTKEELEEIYGVYGKVADVRLVYHKSGKFKNIAYIEYVDEPPAGKAVLATNNLDIRGHKISVAISAPPPKPNVTPMITPKLLGLNTKRKLGEQKPRMSLIPNVVRKKFGAPQTNNSSTITSTSSTSNESTATNGSQTTSKSNEDFRKMLLKE